MATIDNPIIVEQTFNTPVNVIWKAITELDQMHQWFFENIPDFKPEVGFKTQFNVHSGELNFMHLWKITAVQPLKKITYNWKYENYKGDSFVHFELFEQKSGSMLRLTTEITENFTANIPEFKPESCRAGWEYFIQKNLKAYLEKTV
jgi:uncharacterized protein YndB with AHSA1/START domain